METILMKIEKTKDLYDAYSDNCDGIYAAGKSIVEVISDTLKSIEQIKKNLPEDRWPEALKHEYKIDFMLDTESFMNRTKRKPRKVSQDISHVFAE